MPAVLPTGDANYQRWRNANLSGFVLNVRANADSEFMVLHRADCPHIATH